MESPPSRNFGSTGARGAKHNYERLDSWQAIRHATTQRVDLTSYADSMYTATGRI